MANIYDKSSLVLIPSGTKTGKIFSQKPVSGDGDFTFTRASAATRVNADGNIEKETGNLLTYSKNLASSGWTLASATSSAAADFDGGNNANEITGSGFIYQSISGFSGVHTFSVYAKAGNWEGVRLRIDIASNSPQVFFNLSDGSYFSNSNDIDVSITDVGNDWYRCTLTGNVSAANNFRIYPADSTNLGGTGSVILYKAQAEYGLVARDYIETTTAAVYGGITDNTPRLDYTDSSCPALLLEPQRTNLSLQSEYFDVAPSVKDASTIEVNGTTSPSGLDDACLFTETTANDRHGFYQYITITAGALTASIFTKEIDRRYIHFQSNATGSGENSYIDLQDGSVVSEGSGWSLSTEDYGDGWYRIKATCTAVAGNKYFIWGVSQNGTTNSYAGSTSKDFTFYGFQLEAGNYATSYIPTYGSSVSRVAPSISKYNFSDSSTQTLFVEYDHTEYGAGGAEFIIEKSNPVAAVFRIYVDVDASGNDNNRVRFRTEFPVSQLDYDTNRTKRQNQKVAFVISGTTAKAFCNGSLVNTFTITETTMEQLNFRIQNAKFRTKQLLMLPTAITDQEAIDLTTI